MHRIDTPDATRDGRFTEGDPSVPVPATTVSADWLNAVQEEVIAVMTAAGLAPAKNDNAQLLAALKNVVGTVNALTATRLETSRHIDGVSFNGTADIHHYATCATASGTAAKTAALAGFRLQAGAALRVKFVNANTAANATLNVGGTGAKPLHYHGKSVPAGLLAAGHTYAVVYNGTQYEIIGDILVLAAGGGLAFDVKGHLYVDTSAFSEEMLRAFLRGIIADGGGLGFDSSGKLYVDADAFSDDLLERFLKSIRVPIWLERDKSFYVNGETGSDTLGAGRGESTSLPFKTIQACVNYVTDTYNFSRYVATINIASGTYEEHFEIGQFAVTTGRLVIQKDPEYTKRPVIAYKQGGKAAFAVDISGTGNVYFIDIDINIIVSVPEGEHAAATIGTINVDAGLVLLRNCNLYYKTEGGTVRTPSILHVSNTGSVQLSYGVKFISDFVSGTKPFCFLIEAKGAQITMSNIYVEDSNFVKISGDFNTICQCNRGQFYRSATSSPVIIGDGVTGQRYKAASGGGIDTRGGGPDFFPGTSAGTVETSTYSWYK